MAFKYVILLVAAVGAASLQDRSRDFPQQQQQQQRYPVTDSLTDSQDQRSDDSVGYDFSYSVHDPNTGDVKSQEESRRNGNVRGRYSWVDADGNRQIVDYQADDRNGFNSEHRQEPAVRPRPSQLLVPAPLYTIDTVIAPVWTSASRSDNSRSRNRQDRNRSDQDRDQDRDQEDQRNQRDGQDNDRENQRNEQDNRDNRDDRDNRDSRDNRENRDDRDNRDNRDSREQRRDDQRRDEQQQQQRQRSREERGRGRDSHAQSEVRFQAADVAYQYSN